MSGEVFPVEIEKFAIIQSYIIKTIILRPHLEYCAHFWSPMFQFEFKRQQVQRRVIWMIKGMECLSYERILEELCLFSIAQ